MPSAPLVWFLVGLAFLGIELASPTLVLIFFGIGAWATALAALADTSLSVQLVCFMLVSILSLLLLRRHLRSVFGGRAHGPGPEDDSAPPHPLAGRVGVVSRPIAQGMAGEVDIDGSFWRAVSTGPIAAGAQVRVLGTQAGDGLLLRVEQVEQTGTQAGA